MKKLLIVMCLVFVIGCSVPPDFSKPVKIKKKNTNSCDISIYYYKIPDYGAWLWDMNGLATFKAPYSFANVGDTVGYKDGVITVIKRKDSP